MAIEKGLRLYKFPSPPPSCLPPTPPPTSEPRPVRSTGRWGKDWITAHVEAEKAVIAFYTQHLNKK